MRDGFALGGFFGYLSVYFVALESFILINVYIFAMVVSCGMVVFQVGIR